jgi:hypothetical protein
LDPAIFRHLPLASADSVNASLNCGAVGRFGTYCPPHAWQRATVIAWGIEHHASAERWTHSPQHELAI